MNRREGCIIAIIGVLIAVVTIPVGIFFSLVQGTREHWGAAQALVWLAIGGGVVGGTVFFGALLPWGNPQPKPKPPEYRRCSNCAVENFLWTEYCQSCGMPLESSRFADKSGQGRTDSAGRQECPVCHVANADSRRDCVFCGNPMNETAGHCRGSTNNPTS